MNKLQKLSQEDDYSTATSLEGYLHNTTYAQLIEAFGQPTYNQESGDGKVQ